MHRTILLVLGLSLAACGESSPGVEGSCVAAVNVDGITFTGGLPSVAPTDVGEVYLVVSVHTGCQDQGLTEPAVWGPGVSNFLPVGTSIHRVEGYSPAERLTYWSDVIDEWLSLVPLPTH